MEYSFREIEKKWQEEWKEKRVYTVSNASAKPKYYVLDMFPYPSGAGLHVGHPLGYIASDIYSRYKRLKGFNVLHPMGFDSFGLPAEQYAIETGQHPADTTEKNITTFKKQLDKIGFCYDWSREVRTSEPEYYKWTQWIFLQLFNSYFDKAANKAKPIAELVNKFETTGTANCQLPIANSFTAEQWNTFSKNEQEEILMKCRLAFSAYGEVNWCEALGTVLANDEVVNGVSERGGHPVEKKKMRQWYLRITEYADRLLDGLETIDFSDAMKEMQKNWIGKSQGANLKFEISNSKEVLEVYTTRPDTIFGVDFMVVAPEHELVAQITTAEQKEAIEKYLEYVKSRSDRERMAEVKQITGCFTGAYALNPFNGQQIPIWIAEYVLAGYGTGAIMAVPCGDQRDFLFAKHFNIPITNIIGNHYNGEEANPTKEAVLENSDFLNGLLMKDAINVAVEKIEALGIGKRKVNYRMRDAGFSRQRYWGEPFPIIWSDGIALPLDAEELPLELPHVGKYGPGPSGEGPLANLTDWVTTPTGKRETSTMPGYAGSSWYFLRYMDPNNKQTFCDRNVSDYWNQVDLYIGGTEHAVGHLLYSRLWTKVLYDLGHIGFDEPFKKLLNQGMITAIGYYIDSIDYKDESGTTCYFLGNRRDVEQYPSLKQYNGYNINEIENSRSLIRLPYIGQYLDSNNKITRKKFNEYFDKIGIKYWVEDASNFIWVSSNENKDEDFFTVELVSEKMSKSKFNTVNPDELCDKYGADTFRMYEMFLGPVEVSKPWDTKGIEGVHRFIKKLWRLFADEQKGKLINNNAPTAEELKVLHKTIKKIEEDTERFSFNTAVSAFMIAVNELSDLKCHKKSILEQLLILLTPYAPHVSEELWQLIGNSGFIIDAPYPIFDAQYVQESSKLYPVAINGRTRHELNLPLDITAAEVEAIVLKDEVVQKWLEGNAPKKIIFVKNKMINVVL